VIPDSLLDEAIKDTTGQSVGVDLMKAIKMSKQGIGVDSIVNTLGTDMSGWNRFRFRQSVRVVRSEPAEILQQFLNNLPITILVLQPFFALLLWMIYVRNRKRFHYIGHLVFSTYFHATVLIVMIPFLIVYNLTDWYALWLVVLVFFLVYLLLALKSFYKQGWGKTVLKFIIVISTYGLVMVPVVLIVAFMVGLFFV